MWVPGANYTDKIILFENQIYENFDFFIDENIVVINSYKANSYKLNQNNIIRLNLIRLGFLNKAPEISVLHRVDNCISCHHW